MNSLLAKKLPFAAVLLLFVFCWSCSHEPAEPEFQGPNVVNWNDSSINGDAYLSQMHFSVGSNMAVQRGAVTRSTTAYDGTAAFSENDLIAIAVTKSGESEVVKLYRVKSDGSLEYAGGDNDPFVWKSTSETVSLRAWSYGTDATLSYMLDAPETFDYDLETDQQTNGYRELLYCKAANRSYAEGTMTLGFYHQLSRIVFNVDHELEGDLAVTSVAIGGTFPVKARFSVPTGSDNIGSWDIKSNQDAITPHADDTEDGFQRTYSVVVFPKTYAKDSRLFTLTNSDGNYIYDISADAGHTLTAGNQYNYTITVKNGFSQDFDYVASAQTFTTPKTGTYKIECWGASGGDITNISYVMACGGYVSGVIALTKDQELYVYTGQRGNNSDNYSSTYMFNGGGYAISSKGKCGACGGGATDVRTTDGDWDDAASLNSRIIIAAGGGGNGGAVTGACAGGLNGYNGLASGYYNNQGKGASQTGGGAGGARFNSSAQAGTAGTLGKGGVGGHSDGTQNTGGGSGGGGGLYGGGGAGGLTNGTWHGGGGSSYISGHPGCTAQTLTFTNTKMIDGAGYQWTASKGSRVGIPTPADSTVRQNGYLGNGFCRITRYGY